MRLRLAWALSLPLMALASLAVHSLAYRLVAPGPEELAETGHGYLAFAPLAVGLCLALCAAALAARVLGAFASRSRCEPPPWLFAALPPLAFVLQEYAERLVHAGAFPLATATEPVFLAGLALQLPFALVALALARLLLRAAERLGLVLAARRRRPARPSRVVARPVGSSRPRPAALGRANRTRAPPELVAV